MIQRNIALCFLAVGLGLFTACEREQVDLPPAPEGSLTIGGEGNEVGSAVISLPLGGYLAAISKESALNDWDAELLELNGTGDVMSTMSFTLKEESEVIRAIRIRQSGGYLLGSIFQRNADDKVRFRLRVLDENLAVTESFEFGEIQNPYAGSYASGSSHLEVFELNSGGWMVVGQHAFSQVIYQISDAGAVLSQRVVSGDNFYPTIPLHNFAQDQSGTVYRLNLTNNYSSMSMQIEALDASGYALSSLGIVLDSAFIGDYYYPEMYASGLDIHGDNRFVASVFTSEGLQHLFEFDPMFGTILWHRIISVSESLHLLAHDSTGNTYFGGFTPRASYYYGEQQSINGILGVVDAQGNSLRRRTIGGPWTDNLMDMAVGADGKALAIGSTASFGAGGLDAFLVFYP